MGSRPEPAARRLSGAAAILAATIAAALTALACWFGTGLQPLWWLAWLVPLPVLWLALRTGPLVASTATFAGFAIGGANMWRYLAEVIALPMPVVLSAILLPALAMVPVVLLFRALALRGRGLAALLSAPLASTGLSWAMAALSPHGTYGHVAYSQMDALAVIQLAAITGLWGIGFLLWLPATALALLTSNGRAMRQRWLVAGTTAGILALSLGYGAWRLQGDASVGKLRIGLVSIGEMRDSEADLSKPAGRTMLARYLAEFDRLADAGAQVVVAPESALRVQSQAIDEIAALARRRGIRVLVGVEDRSDASVARNAALVFGPEAASPASYYKQHLIPVYEDRYTPGATRTMLPGTPRIGTAICKDLDFTRTGLDYGRLQAQLLLVPAWDFIDDAWLHGRMAVLRGVEGGFAMARSARGGHLTLSDDRGRVLAAASAAGVARPVTLLADVPLKETRTPYARWGDAFGWLSLLAALVLAASLVWRGGRASAR